MTVSRNKDCDAWVILSTQYFNSIHHHVAMDGPAPQSFAGLMTLSTRIIASAPEGLWVATRRPIQEKGRDVGEKDGKFLIPWRYVEGVHVLDEDLPEHEIGRMGFNGEPIKRNPSR
jgi:hypothetical protein